MCLKWLLACLLAGCLVLISMGKASSVPLPHADEDAAAWGPVRSLGKMWQYHRLLGISPDGQRLLVGGNKGLLVYDLPTGDNAVLPRSSCADPASNSFTTVPANLARQLLRPADGQSAGRSARLRRLFLHSLGPAL